MNNFDNETKKFILEDFCSKNNIDNDYLDFLIQGKDGFDLKCIWQFCFRNCSNIKFNNIDLKKLLKCNFNLDTIFPEEISKRININKIYSLAEEKHFGMENLSINSEKIKIAVLDQGFKKNSKKFAKNVQIEGVSYEDAMHSNAILYAIYNIIPDSKIYHYVCSIKKNEYKDRVKYLNKIFK